MIRSGGGSAPFGLVEQTPLGQFTGLVAVEIKPAGHDAGVLVFGGQGNQGGQEAGEERAGNDEGDPLHKGTLAGQAGSVHPGPNDGSGGPDAPTGPAEGRWSSVS